MIDHIGFAVSNMQRSKTFYVDALKPLGIGVVMEVTAEQTGAEAHAGFGKDNKAFFRIGGAQSPKVGRMSPLQPPRGPTSILSTARL
jgi:catechol 2,3-dioxygenase-like lactoylglutathione lyase family enzyme